MTPQNVANYLITNYLYHWTCMVCGNVKHSLPGVGGGADGGVRLMAYTAAQYDGFAVMGGA